jgi:hypothetical protein
MARENHHSPSERTAQDISCPICLSSFEDNDSSIRFAKTECGHVFCVSCIQRVLCKSRSIYDTSEDECIQHMCITRGKCPICRSNVNLFELRDVISPQSFVVEKNRMMSSWPIGKSIYKQRVLGRQASDFANRLDEVAVSEGPVKGFGMQISFDKIDAPYIISLAHHGDECDDFGLAEDVWPRCITFNDFHFHVETMTFHGSASAHVQWATRSYLYKDLDCVLQFSPDGRYIRDGYLSWSYFNPSSLSAYPMDGVWKCEVNSEETILIHVQLHSFSLKDTMCRISINDKNKACFKWPNSSYIHVSDQEMPFGSTGPDIGEVLCWESNRSFEYREWTRVSKTLEGVSTDVRMTPLSSKGFHGQFIYQRVTDKDQILHPTYNADSIWGNTFCQAFTIGLASYHFLKPDDDSNEYIAYISYENPKTTQWPNLDNGEPIPSRVQFRNIQWDEEARTFKGDILWIQDHKTTWRNDSKWTYVLKFDPIYKFIASGTCTMANREPHQFGEDLVYINAAMDKIFKDALDSGTSTGDYINILRNCREHGASESTIECLGEVAMSIMHRGPSRFDYNL